jgi:hypothetical protein
MQCLPEFLPEFMIETVDGCRLGRLQIPFSQMADWLNFLLAPQYDAAIISAEQQSDGLSLYFEASEGLYLYLQSRLRSPLSKTADNRQTLVTS